MGFFQFRTLCFCIILVSCWARSQHFGRIYPGFEGSPKDWLDHNGVFLLSNNSIFSLGFYNALDVSSYALVIQHKNSSVAIWTGNRGLLVNSSDRFVFAKNGNVFLEGGGGGPGAVVWSTNTSGKQVSSMELLDSGNLVLLDADESIVWQSFSHPSDTLVPGQEFLQGMRLKSFPYHATLYHYLEILSGDLLLYAGYKTRQLYWSISNETRKISGNSNSTNGIGKVHSVSLVSNSWNFYDQNRGLLWQFVFAGSPDPNAFWVAVLGTDGSVSFKNLNKPKSDMAETTKIPEDVCGVPEHCSKEYEVCSFGERCQCPDNLKSIDCKPQTTSSCDSTSSSSDLVYVGEKLNYFALGFVQPLLKSNLNACRDACVQNCSCLVMFFNSTSGGCFLFDQIGNLQRADPGSLGVISYMKIWSNVNGGQGMGHKGKQSILSIMFIVLATIIVISGLVYIGLWFHRKRQKAPESLEEDNFLDLDSFSGLPVRYTYNDLLKVTKNFTSKIGEGGFGSVYSGVLPDDTKVAVKKLEGVGQGKKEFRAEVSIIGNIHHVHLVKLKGYCAEGTNRLLVYEHMQNGSLDKWIFNNEKGPLLDWNTRFSIALGTAKGLAYLHEECEFKIIHCDIKPENVLLDDNFTAKVSDFGLAKLMNRDDSFVYTTLRGTRGYLAPEWITNYAISEKSDVYSYGLVLLEIIAGRKNYDPVEYTEKSNFPSYAFKMMEEGNLKEIVDPKLEVSESDESVINAIKVALWCIQDEMRVRPTMTKVVQMLEGLCAVPQPPTTFQMGARADMSFLKWSGGDGDGSSSGFTDFNSAAFQAGSRLSGPR